jgi:hypothetical protein
LSRKAPVPLIADSGVGQSRWVKPDARVWNAKI